MQIAVIVRDAALDLMRHLPSIAARYSYLVGELATLWASPYERIGGLLESDPASFKLTAQYDPDHEGDGGQGDDTKSEFSAASNLSRVSYVSHASMASRQSSGTSSVSVLSELNLHREGTHRHGTSSVASDAFSISGIDHSLLSRGKHSELTGGETLTRGGQIQKSKNNQRKVSEKRQRKWDRKKNARGNFGHDEYDLKREKILCIELWSLAHFNVISDEAKALCDALILLHDKQMYAKNKIDIKQFKSLPPTIFNTTTATTTTTSTTTASTAPSSRIELADYEVSSALQSAVDDLATHYQSSPPPIAPLYPIHFLRGKNMTILIRFQDASALSSTTINDNTPEFTALLTRIVDTTYTTTQQSQSQAQYEQNGSVIIESIQKATQENDNWWRTAADGIVAWQGQRRLGLN